MNSFINRTLILSLFITCGLTSPRVFAAGSEWGDDTDYSSDEEAPTKGLDYNHPLREALRDKEYSQALELASRYHIDVIMKLLSDSVVDFGSVTTENLPELQDFLTKLLKVEVRGEDRKATMSSFLMNENNEAKTRRQTILEAAVRRHDGLFLAFFTNYTGPGENKFLDSDDFKALIEAKGEGSNVYKPLKRFIQDGVDTQFIEYALKHFMQAGASIQAERDEPTLLDTVAKQWEDSKQRVKEDVEAYKQELKYLRELYQLLRSMDIKHAEVSDYWSKPDAGSILELRKQHYETLIDFVTAFNPNTFKVTRRYEEGGKHFITLWYHRPASEHEKYPQPEQKYEEVTLRLAIDGNSGEKTIEALRYGRDGEFIPASFQVDDDGKMSIEYERYDSWENKLTKRNLISVEKENDYYELHLDFPEGGEWSAPPRGDGTVPSTLRAFLKGASFDIDPTQGSVASKLSYETVDDTRFRVFSAGPQATPTLKLYFKLESLPEEDAKASLVRIGKKGELLPFKVYLEVDQEGEPRKFVEVKGKIDGTDQTSKIFTDGSLESIFTRDGIEHIVTTSPRGEIVDTYADAAGIKHTVTTEQVDVYSHSSGTTSSYETVEHKYTDADGNKHTIVNKSGRPEMHLYTDTEERGHYIISVPNFGPVEIISDESFNGPSELSVDNGKTFHPIKEPESKEDTVISVDWNNDGTFVDFFEFTDDETVKLLQKPPAHVVQVKTPKPVTAASGTGQIGSSVVTSPKKTDYTPFIYTAAAVVGAVGVYKLYRWWKKRQKTKPLPDSEAPEQINYFGDTAPATSGK